MPRLAIARFSHEGNSFSPVLTDAAAFRRDEWYLGQEAGAVYRGTATEGGGAVAFLDAHPYWSGTFLRMAGATPAGLLIALDRQERGQDKLSAVQELSTEGLKVVSVITLADVERYLAECGGFDAALAAIRIYRQNYGV